MLKSCGAANAGDSACSIPPQTIPAECLEVIRDWTTKLAKELKVVGLINIQYCIQDNQVTVLCYIHVEEHKIMYCQAKPPIMHSSCCISQMLRHALSIQWPCTLLCFRRCICLLMML